MSPHQIGIIGESLNFFGAIAMGFDLLLRRPERARGKRLKKLHDFAIRTGLDSVVYKGFTVSSDDFIESVLDRRAAQFGFAGVALLAFGFLLLVVYHWREM